MKAISLWQPWASAVAVGSKRFETRSWQFPKAFTGEVIAIHASKKWTGELREWANELRLKGTDLGFTSIPPLGGIVATATLKSCIPVESRSVSSFECMLGNYEPGRFAWELTNVHRLAEMIPCTGRQGFWELEPHVNEAIGWNLYGAQAK